MNVAGPDGPSAPEWCVEPLGDNGIDDLIALRLAWKPAATDAEAEQLAADLRDWWRRAGDTRRGWVARHTDGSPIGMANAAIFERMPVPGVGSARWAYVANVFVLEGFRRQGVAAAIMTELIAWCRDNNLVRIVLAPSEMSIPFYAELGFRVADNLMRLDLT